MSSDALMLAALGTVVACGFALWGLHAVAQVHERMGSFDGFEGMHFEN